MRFLFATQIPLFEEKPANQCIIKVEKIFANNFKEIGKDKYILHSAPEYYDMVAECTDKIEIWITDYCHEMDNHGKILEFLKGVALRPYIDRLNEEEQKVFMDEVIFKRLFCFRAEEIIFHRKAAAMFCRLASLSSWFRRQVIHDGRITSGIADHIQIGIFVHDTDKVLFGIPAVTEDDHVFPRT